MNSHSTPRIQNDPRLAQLVADATRVVREEVGEQAEKLHLYWRLEKNWSSGGTRLALVMMDSTACEAKFTFGDLTDDMDGLRRQLRLWCGNLIKGGRG